MRAILWSLGLISLAFWTFGGTSSALADNDLCANFTQPGCVQTGCLQGELCDTTVGCFPSACACDPDTGQIICTEDCGGGICVPDEPPTCCDPADEPGTGDNPFCFEGASCCADGSWSCNNGAGQTTCDVVGDVCEGDLCADFTPPGCVQTGCLEGQVCDTTVGCVPSACACDPDTGQILCTADCGGGTCVPEPTNALLGACALVTLAMLKITPGWRERSRNTNS